MNEAIKIEGLSKNYGDFRALDNLQLTVEKGHIVGFLGPNGAGKTTTIKISRVFFDLPRAVPTSGASMSRKTRAGRCSMSERWSRHRRCIRS